MDIDELRKHCLKKAGVTEGFPFDNDTLVFKVGYKIFALINLNPPLSINLKCNPEIAIDLREEHEEIKPGYHMNKRHWNTIDLEGRLTNEVIIKLVNNSYDLVYQKLSNKEKEAIAFDK